jgi:membrane-bound serine protease (ClpP class)
MILNIFIRLNFVKTVSTLQGKMSRMLKSKLIVALFPILLFMFCVTSVYAVDEMDIFAPTGKNDIVYFVPQFSDFKEISEQDLLFLKKILKKAEHNNVRAVIFELDTPGGRIDVALKYVSVLIKAKVPTVAFVNPQGISAGLIIALAANRIAINPAGVIGDAMPIQLRPDGIKPITDKTDDADKNKKNADNKDTAPANKDKNKPEDNNSYTPLLERILKEMQNNKTIEKNNEQSNDEKLSNQKFLTVFFKVLEVLAQKNNRPERVIRAMADPYQKLTEKDDRIEHQKVSPLTLSATEAKKLKVVDYICSDREHLLRELRLDKCKVETVIKSPTEQLVSFLSHPAVSAILLVLGILGLYIEMQSPHFGVSGALGLTALTLFFLGHVASGASDWGPMVIFFVGLILLMLEIFLIPGFGIVGVLGISCVVISFFGAFGTENIETAVYAVGSALAASITAIIFLTMYILPKSKLFERLKLQPVPVVPGDIIAAETKRDLLHKNGTAHTILRPAGTVIIDDEFYDVVTAGDFIQKGDNVEVIKVDGLKITVRKI